MNAGFGTSISFYLWHKKSPADARLF